MGSMERHAPGSRIATGGRELQRDLAQRIETAQQELGIAQRKLRNAVKDYEGWDWSITDAQRERTRRLRAGTLSARAQEVSAEMILEATARRDHTKTAMVDPLTEQVNTLSSTVEQLKVLRKRLEVQLFREDFTRHAPALPPSAQASTQESELRAIRREVHTLDHTIDALIELRQH